MNGARYCLFVIGDSYITLPPAGDTSPLITNEDHISLIGL